MTIGRAAEDEMGLRRLTLSSVLRYRGVERGAAFAPVIGHLSMPIQHAVDCGDSVRASGAGVLDATDPVAVAKALVPYRRASNRIHPASTAVQVSGL